MWTRLVVVLALVACLWTHRVAAETTLSSFQRWFNENGGIARKVDVSSFPHMGNGVRAVERVPAGDLVLKVPYYLIFSHASLMRISRLAEKDEQDTTPLPLSEDDVEDLNLLEKFFNSRPMPNAAGRERVLIAWLLRELMLGEESFYAPYLQVLPSHVSSALHFSLTELQTLQSPSLLADIQEFQRSTREDFQRFMRIVRDSAGTFPYLESVAWEDYLWAATILHSRGLRFRGEIFLTPFSDMFNYAPHSDVRAAASGAFFLKHHVLDEKSLSLSIYADRDTEANAQLFEDYGDNPNEVYFKYHGFVPAQNPFHCVAVRWPAEHFAQRVVVRLSVRQKDVLQRLRFSLTEPISACVNAQGDLGKQLQVYLSILSFNDDEAARCVSVLNGTLKKNAKTVDWPAIFRGCGFDGVSARFDAFVDHSPSSSSSLDALRERDTEQEGESLTSRALSLWQDMLSVATDALDAPTTLEEDLQALPGLERAVATSVAGGDEYKHALHTLIAVQFRAYNKRHYGKLCALFGARCAESVTLSRSETKRSESLVNAAAEEVLSTDVSATDLFSHVDDEVNTLSRAPIDLFAPRDPSSLDRDLSLFNAWFSESGPPHAKIRAVSMPNYRIGTVATEEIRHGDMYLGVPQRVILSAEKAYDSSTSSEVSALLHALSERYQGRRDDFHELLVLLVHEALVARDSFYWPYLNLLPRLSELDAPILWNISLAESRLAPSHILSQIKNYQQSVQKKYTFLKDIPEVQTYFNEKWNFPLTEDVYRWASAILDSRSIWWEGKRHLVPMLDFVNCKEQEAHPDRVHSTTLDGKKENAITRADGDYAPQEQLFENYGQPNNIYFLYHGFSLLFNTHDCVHHEFTLTANERKQLNEKEINRRILQNLRVSAEDNMFTSCLQSPISTHTWAFLSLKTNTHYDLLDSRKLGTPTRPAAELLIKEIECRIEGYESFDRVE